MIIQLALNWQAANCGTDSNFFQLAFIFIILVRIFTQEAHNNKIIERRTFKAVTLFTSGCLLTALGIYEAYTIAKNSFYFEYDAKTKTGNIVCFQNRIVYVAEIILCFLTIIKDIVFIIIGEGDSDRQVNLSN